jgi:putative membrane protein
MMSWYGGGWAWWQAGLTWIAMIAFWALVIWAIYALVTGVTRRGGDPDRGGRQPGGAQRVLDERLARGEIEPRGVPAATRDPQRRRERAEPAGTGGAR